MSFQNFILAVNGLYRWANEEAGFESQLYLARLGQHRSHTKCRVLDLNVFTVY